MRASALIIFGVLTLTLSSASALALAGKQEQPPPLSPPPFRHHHTNVLSSSSSSNKRGHLHEDYKYHDANDDVYFGDKGTAALSSAATSHPQSLLSSKRRDQQTPNRRHSGNPNPKQPENPVIALVANPMSDCPDENEHPELAPPVGFKPTGCFTDFYLKWLQPQGVRVVPMNAFWPDEKKKELLDQVNGVMLLGGGLDGDDRVHYTNNVSYIFDYAMERPGFLLWGTCQGMQVMSILLHRNNFDILTCDYVGTEPSMLPLEMTPYQPKSTLFGLEAQRLGIASDLIEYNTTLNWHHCGVDPEVFANSANKTTNIIEASIIANNVDINGKPFVSAFEIVEGGRNIFAVQYHPERPALWFANDVIGHDRKSIDVANYHARFIADRLKMNSHTFGDQLKVSHRALDSFPRRYAGWGTGWIWVDI